MSKVRVKNATLVVKKPGFLIPNQYLELVLPKSAAAGYAIQIPGEGSLEFDTMSERAPTIDEFNELQTAFKDNWGLFYLLDAAGQKFDPEDIQPFTLAVGEEGEEPRHLLAFTLEGDFPGYSQQNNHNDEYNLVDEILMPSLQKTYNFCTNNGVADLDKFFSELHDPVFNKTLLNTMAHRGAFAFLPLHGDAVMIGKNELGDVFEWGQVSQTHSYSENKAVSQEPEPKKKGWWSSKAKAEEPKAAATSVPKTPTTAPKTEAKPTVIENKPKIEAPKTETSALGEGHYVDLPANLTKKDKKKLIRKLMGLNPSDQLPIGWDKAGYKVFVKGPAPEAKAPVKDLKDLKTAMDNKVVDIKSAKPEAKPEVKPVQARAEATMEQTLSAQEKSNLEGFILKYLDTQSQVVPDPKNVQKVEEKYPSFTEAGGIKITDTLLWPTDTVVALFKSHPKAAMLWALELRRALLPHYKMEDLIPAKKPAPAPEVKTPTPEPEAPVEEKKVANGKLGGSFWGRRK